MLALVLMWPLADPARRAAAALFAAMPMLSIYPVLAHRHGHVRFCAAVLLAATLAPFASITELIATIPSS
jgi:malonate transporter